MVGMWMIVGLGNPGPDYADTRHNVGFAVVDALAETLGVKVAQRKFGGKVATADVAGKTVLLLKPLTYMNRSGQSVATAVGFYKVLPEQVMVILDDMDMEPGRIRLRAQGSAGGHHGLEDVIRCLGTDRLARCRVGIGSRGRQDGADYVLGRPTAEEQALLDAAVRRSRDAVLYWLDHGRGDFFTASSPCLPYPSVSSGRAADGRQARRGWLPPKRRARN